jgi:AcrR family transcriptional regulator
VRAGQAAGGRLLTARGLRTRAQLVDAAKKVFAETPFADTRIADITARAGVANGTFYTYFDSKEAIFREVAADVLAAMLEAPRQVAAANDHDPIRTVEQASKAYFRVVVDNATVARSIEQLSPADADVAAARNAIFVAAIKRSHAWITRLQHAGICDDGIDSWTAAVALQTMTVRVAYDHLLPQAGSAGADVDVMARTVSQIWARAVGLEAVAPRSPRRGADREGT